MSGLDFKTIWEENRRYAITAFILFFLYCAAIDILPRSYLKTTLSAPVYKTASLLGLEQRFHTFSPEPPRRNSRIYAYIKAADGSTSIWNYPDVERLGNLQRKIRAPRFRILATKNLRKDSILWTDFARYVARENNKSASSPPANITFYKHTEAIPEINPTTGQLKSKENKEEFVFHYKVTSGDLQE